MKINEDHEDSSYIYIYMKCFEFPDDSKRCQYPHITDINKTRTVPRCDRPIYFTGWVGFAEDDV